MNAADDSRLIAARWFARARAQDFGPEEQRALAAWLAESPGHQAEYSALQRIWETAGAIDPVRLRKLAAEDGDSRPPVSAARPATYARAAAFTAVTALALGAAWFGWHWSVVPSQLASKSTANQIAGQAEYRTAPGERRTVQLGDGSRVELNTRTRMLVRLASGERNVDLLEGEAMFDVAHDSSRPFVIQAGPGKVTVTGTRFDVRRDMSRTAVAVESGSVAVQGLGTKQSARLTAGLGATIDSRGAVSDTAPVDLPATLAWRSGKLMFNDMPLTNVVAEVSRYRQQPVRIADNAAGQLRVSSVFNADDTDGFLAALPRMLPVDVRELPDGSTGIYLR